MQGISTLDARWGFAPRRVIGAAALAMLSAIPMVAQAAWSCPGGPFGHPVPPDAQITRIDNALPRDAFNQNGQLNANVEGPVWRDGALYFSEFGAGANPPPTRILRYAGDGPGTVFAATAGDD